MTISATTGVLLALGLFLSMLVLLEVGRRTGISRRQAVGEAYGAGLGAVEGAVFGLLGLLGLPALPTRPRSGRRTFPLHPYSS